MPCSACFKKYGLFLRETGCSKCGFSFCGKCCNYELPGVKKKVCLSCYHKGKQSKEKPAQKPAAAVAKDELPSPKVPNETPEVPSPVDLQLQKRLADLKKADEGASTSKPVTDLDLKERLAKLQDRPFVEDKPNRDIFHIDQRSEQQKVNDLVEQYNSETAIDRASDPVKDLEQRLNKLRGIDGTSALPGGSAMKSATQGDDGEDADKQYVKKIIAEAMLDAQLKFTDEEREIMENIPKPPDTAENLEELPWCTICNEDAKIRCVECDDELYCKACFREIHHDDEEYRSHRTKAYQKPKAERDLSSSEGDD